MLPDVSQMPLDASQMPLRCFFSKWFFSMILCSMIPPQGSLLYHRSSNESSSMIPLDWFLFHDSSNGFTKKLCLGSRAGVISKYLNKFSQQMINFPHAVAYERIPLEVKRTLSYVLDELKRIQFPWQTIGPNCLEVSKARCRTTHDWHKWSAF